MWKRRVAKMPAGPAFRHFAGETWKTISYAEADAAAQEIAAGLVVAGVVPGDRVCLVAQTRLEWALCDVGILLAGGVTVPIYASNTAEQCEFIIRDAGAKIVIVEDVAQRDKVLPLRDRLYTVTGIVQIADEAPGGTTSVRWRRCAPTDGAGWRHTRVPAGSTRTRETVGPESMFTIVYTSGTTGTPKGVVLTHENLTSSVCSAMRAMGVNEGDEQYLFLPLAHILARQTIWVGFEAGYVTTFSRGTTQIKEDLAAVRPTFMAGVPRIYEKFYAGVNTALAQGSGLKRRLAAWALRSGRAHAAAERAGGIQAGSATGWPTSWSSPSCARASASIAAASSFRGGRRSPPRSPNSSRPRGS